MGAVEWKRQSQEACFGKGPVYCAHESWARCAFLHAVPLVIFGVLPQHDAGMGDGDSRSWCRNLDIYPLLHGRTWP